MASGNGSFPNSKFSTKPKLTFRRVLGSRRLIIYIALLLIVVGFLIAIRLVTKMRASFENFHYVSDTDFELVTLPQNFAFARGARCLDGSPPGYYYRAGAASSEYWILHLLPGAWCKNAEECYERSSSSKGSSRRAITILTLNGIFSKDCNYNPAFCHWNVAIFLYCDGSSFLGNHSSPYVYKSQQLYRRGALIFDAIVEYLTMRTSLKQAEQIILTGSSAGGIAALIHADRLRSKLPLSVHSLHVVLDGSVFVNTPDVSGNYPLAELFKSLYDFHNIKDAQSIQECTRTKSDTEAWKCLFVGTYHSFVFTPIFIINSGYDLWQRENGLRIPCFENVCPDSNVDIVNIARDTVYQEVQDVIKSEKNGAFLTYCPAHCLMNRWPFFELMMGSTVMNESLSLWLRHSKSLELSSPLTIREGIRTCGTYQHDWKNRR